MKHNRLVVLSILFILIVLLILMNLDDNPVEALKKKSLKNIVKTIYFKRKLKDLRNMKRPISIPIIFPVGVAKSNGG